MNNTKFTLLKVRGYDTVLCDAPVPERFFRAEDATLDAARGAHDSLQIIICANEAISSFSVVLSDLKSEDGDVIKADAASVYLVKYTEVAPVVERFYNFGEGKYPNAISPRVRTGAFIFLSLSRRPRRRGSIKAASRSPRAAKLKARILRSKSGI